MAASYTIKVAFKPKAKHKIQATPNSQTAAFGVDDFYWVQSGTNKGKWTFQSLVFDPATAIAKQSVTNRTMSIVDWNDATTVQTISYTIGITYDNTIYYSDPYILNDPEGG